MTKEQILALAGEPVAHMYPDKVGRLAGLCFVGGEQTGDIPLFTADQLLAAVKPLEDEIEVQLRERKLLSAAFGEKLAVIKSLRAQLAELESEVSEQCRLNGMGSEREYVLQGKISELKQQLESYRADAERYRWLVENSYDKEKVMQLHVWKHTREPHSQTGVPIEWKCRVRGTAIDAAIDAARKEGE